MHTKKIYAKYFSYVSSLTSKRITILVPIGIAILIILMVLDVVVIGNKTVPYTRLLPIPFGVILLFIKYFKIKVNQQSLTLIYNIFISSTFPMMLIRFGILFEADHEYLSVTGILISIFIMSLEVRANIINSIIIYLLPFLAFIIYFYLNYSSIFNNELYTAFVNITIFLIIGFFVNQVQNKYRFKTFEANYLLDLEKKKLENSNEELKVYQENLQSIVDKKTIQLQKALEKAKESDKLKTAFLRNISHEIRTPINGIAGLIETFASNDKSLAFKFNIINDGFQTLINTIDDIILLSKLETGDKDIVKNKFKLKEFVNDIFETLLNKIKENNKEIDAVLEYNKLDNYIITSNEQSLKKVLSLVIDNAVKFTNEGEISFKSFKKDDKVAFLISDCGQGIQKKYIKNVYDPFWKFEDKDNLFRGAGIGLTIAKKLITLLNGNISIYSNNKGTTVEIIIPIK